MLLRTERVGLLLLSLLIFLFTGTSFAQVTASMSGTVKDSTGAVIPDATVTVKHTETGLTRTAQTDANGSFSIPSIPVGQYEVTFEKPGFKTQVRQGINLVVGQQGVVNVAMEVGNVEQQVTVTAEAPLVNTTTSSTSGVVTEEQVKDLPLNGRSFDQLLTLNAHTNNYTTNDSRPAFSVAGKRVETNIFLINGVEYIGSDSTGQHVLPTGSSNSLLGVDAIREFNVQSEAYGAEYGKRAGAQVSIVTSSGTNQLHGDIFEFLRNTDLDAESFFFKPAPGVLPDVLKRNQFGGALGGPLVRDKMFLFGSYEGVRQRRATSQTANVPDAQARLGLLPNASGQYAPVTNLDTRMLPLVQIAWPDPNTWPGGCSEVFTISGLPTGVCNVVVNPLSSVREDFGVVRYDYNLSSKDSFSLNALYDNGITVSAGTLPFAGSEAALRSAVYSLQETRIFSPTVLNTFTFGLTRALADNTPTPYALFNGPKPPIPALAYFINAPDQAPGQIAVGGGTSGAAGTNSTITSGLGSSSRRLVNVRNLFTYADDVHLTKGRHNFSIGARFQRVQQNASGTPANGAGQATFSNETTLLQGIVGTFLAVPQTTWLYWHSTEGGIYAQDEIKLKPNLTVRLGLRDEFTNGMNEAHGRAAQYLYTNGVINTLPTVTPQVFTENNAKSLWQPRVGIAWDPSGNGKWSVRAGFGMYNDLLDNLAHRLDSNPPTNTRLSVTNQPFFGLFPIDGTKPLRPLCTTTPPPPAAANICVVPAPGGIEPTAHTPTVQQWNLSIERQLSSNLVLHLGYTGMEAFHTVVLEDSNFGNFPAICNNAAGCRSGGANTTGIGVGVVPQGTYYLPLQVDANGTPTGCRINCDIADPQTWFYNGTMNYQGLDIYVQQRFSHGVTYRINYTWAKVLDINSGLLNSEASNEPQDLYNYFDERLNRGPAAFDVRHQFNVNASYQLPFGQGRPFFNNASGLMERIIGGWQVNGIFNAQTGFPFTPQAGSNISGSGDSHQVDLPNVNPNFSGQKYDTRNTSHYYNAAAFLLPLPGTFGNVQRSSWTGPGLVNTDLSLFKKFKVRESQNLEFRAEAFNLFNHPNFGSPNPTVFTSSGAVSPTYGSITKLNGTNRVMQFALKFIF